VVILDGQVLTVEDTSGHWQHARVLLDATLPEPKQDEFARQWYWATSAWQAIRGKWAESEGHLRHARDVFPTDSRILFYSGVMSEVIADSTMQAARESAKRVGLSPMFESRQDALVTALAFLRRAVALEPGFAEGHLHLGRVLALLGRHDEAVRELADALSGLTDDELRYDAQLFVGGEQEIQGQLESARASFARAATAFPTAQSPLFALSRIARLAGDASGAAAAFHRLQALTGRVERVDPWWTYGTSHARNAEELMSAVMARVKDVR
jgi:tetratricopeptide (TPR) repeat protein